MRMTTSRWLSATTMTVLVLTGGAVGAAALSHTAAVSNQVSVAVYARVSSVGQGQDLDR
ncbi:hypothetical protein [Micromonospora sp. NBC_00898]|uniref:hypothetical protein n=1 Tax=Micromonospora sp. NBC_00898 TaxID=2975981 RepID=UPI003869AAC5